MAYLTSSDIFTGCIEPTSIHIKITYWAKHSNYSIKYINLLSVNKEAVQYLWISYLIQFAGTSNVQRKRQNTRRSQSTECPQPSTSAAHHQTDSHTTPAPDVPQSTSTRRYIVTLFPLSWQNSPAAILKTYHHFNRHH